jgi:hypothetical protein
MEVVRSSAIRPDRGQPCRTWSPCPERFSRSPLGGVFCGDLFQFVDANRDLDLLGELVCAPGHDARRKGGVGRLTTLAFSIFHTRPPHHCSVLDRSGNLGRLERQRAIGREGQPHLGKRRLEVGELDRQRPHDALETVIHFSEDPGHDLPHQDVGRRCDSRARTLQAAQSPTPTASYPQMQSTSMLPMLAPLCGPFVRLSVALEPRCLTIAGPLFRLLPAATLSQPAAKGCSWFYPNSTGHRPYVPR